MTGAPAPGLSDRGDRQAQTDGTGVRSTTNVFALELSGPGTVVGLLFFALSLLPSMLPRGFLFQGIVSGITVMIGYALGVAGQWAWHFLGVPPLRGRVRTGVVGVVLAVAALVVAWATW